MIRLRAWDVFSRFRSRAPRIHGVLGVPSVDDYKPCITLKDPKLWELWYRRPSAKASAGHGVAGTWLTVTEI